LETFLKTGKGVGMGLDATLSDEYKDAVDLGLFPDISEAKKAERYKGVEQGQFADPANRAFPCNTAERCRSAMVYLNKYYNNPSSSGVTADYSNAKFKEVHNRIVKFMKKFGIEHDGCSICKKSKSAKNAKGGIEDMSELEDVKTEEVVEETVAETETEETTPEVEEVVADVESEKEEVEASEDDVLDTDVEPEDEAQASEEETTEVSEEVTEEEPEVEASEKPVSIRLAELLTTLTEITDELNKPHEEVEASDEERKIEMLTNELAEAHKLIAQYKAKEVGSVRFSELAEAGITFKEESISDRIARFGTMSDDEFTAYKSDLLSVAKVEAEEATASVAEEKVEKTNAGIETPPVFLPIVENPEKTTQKDEFKGIYSK
jgi:hypothetical protein